MTRQELVRYRELKEWSKAKTKMATLSAKEAWLVAKECWLKLAERAELERHPSKEIERRAVSR
jgi:hypothetical protein